MGDADLVRPVRFSTLPGGSCYIHVSGVISIERVIWTLQAVMLAIHFVGDQLLIYV